MSGARSVLGRRGEDRAAAWYQAAGFTILDRNWRVRGGELDIVAQRGSLVVFCEVKARTTTAFGHPVEAVTPAKAMRVRRLAAQWLALNPVRGDVRFDVACVLGDQLEVVESAF